jgi:HEAT repeat protein
LAGVLKGSAPQAAKDFVCRKLSLIGTAECVPAVAPLLTDEKLSNMARFALERVPDEAATQALRDALPKVKGALKVGVINSLAARRDEASTDRLSALVSDSDAQVASAAVAALGQIGTSQTAKLLGDFQKKAPEGLQLATADARLACAERLLAAGKKAEALAIYKSVSQADLPKHVKLAGMRGVMAAMEKK